jgi:hypothetical protein
MWEHFRHGSSVFVLVPNKTLPRNGSRQRFDGVELSQLSYLISDHGPKSRNSGRS